MRRIEADRSDFKHEAEMLQKANAIAVGPKFIAISNNLCFPSLLTAICLRIGLKPAGKKSSFIRFWLTFWSNAGAWTKQVAVAQPSNSSVVPATLWQKDYQEYSVLFDAPSLSNLIQTSDGGFAHVMGAYIVKTDSNNQTRFEKYTIYNRTRSIFEIERNISLPDIPVGLNSLIETSDGSLAAVGVALTVSDNPYMGTACLIKTEAFLPLPTPSPTASPTLLPTPIKHLSTVLPC
jgi:hypothetical protein